jgi:hypothetical protein
VVIPGSPRALPGGLVTSTTHQQQLGELLALPIGEGWGGRGDAGDVVADLLRGEPPLQIIDAFGVAIALEVLGRRSAA